MATPAITVPYGRMSYWDQLDQQKAQGKNVSDKQLMNLAYGERFAELSNEMNRQKINRELAQNDQRIALDSRRVDMDQNRLDYLKKSNNYALGGQALALALKYGPDIYKYGNAAVTYANTLLNPNFTGDLDAGNVLDFSNYNMDLWDQGAYAFDPMLTGGDAIIATQDALTSGVDVFGDGSMAFAEGGAELYDPMMTGVDAYTTAGEAASSYSFPYYTVTKYGTKFLNEFAQANDIQAIKNFTEPLSGAFDALGQGLGKLFTGFTTAFGDVFNFDWKF